MKTREEVEAMFADLDLDAHETFLVQTMWAAGSSGFAVVHWEMFHDGMAKRIAAKAS